jgi:quinol monooxygenase YgiN
MDGRKYIIGWLTFPPGGRDAFLAIARPYAAACRAEDGCLFFEMNPSADDPDVVTVTECFRSAAAHDSHLQGALFRGFWPELERRCLRGRFENIVAAAVIPDSAVFGGPL